MSISQQIKDGAKDAIKEVTGTPAEQLRGLSPESFLRNFAAQRLAQLVVSDSSPVPRQPVETTRVELQPQGIRTNEQPMPPQLSNGTGGGGEAPPISNVIISMAGTLYYADIQGTITGPV